MKQALAALAIAVMAVTGSIIGDGSHGHAGAHPRSIIGDTAPRSIIGD